MPAILALIARAAISAGAKRLLTRELLAKRITPAIAKGVLNKAKTEGITSKDVKVLLKEKQLGPKKRMKTPLGGKIKSEGTGGRAGQPEKKDMAAELYKQYKKKPDTKTVLTSYQKDRVTKESVLEKNFRERRKRIEEGTSPEKVKPPKPKKLSGLTERQKLDIQKAQNIKKEEPIEARYPAPNPEKPPRSETAAFRELSKSEKQNYREVQTRLNEAIKKIRAAERGKKPAKNLPKRGKTN